MITKNHIKKEKEKMKPQDREILKKQKKFSFVLDQTQYDKLQELKKKYNLSIIFRNALDDFYEENIPSKKK